MLPLALRRARLRFALGLTVALTLPLWLPDAPSARIWTLTALALLAPWLVLGRDARSNAEGWRAALCNAPRAGRLVLLELVPPLTIAALAAALGTAGLDSPGSATPALVLFTWTAALICIADALDRRLGRPGPAWVLTLTTALAITTAPLWLAPTYAAPLTPWLTPLAPSIATLAIGLHPAAATLAAAGHATLQDPIFYTYTLSGVVEVRPLGWPPAAALFTATAILGAIRAIHAVRRPPLTALNLPGRPV